MYHFLNMNVLPNITNLQYYSITAKYVVDTVVNVVANVGVVAVLIYLWQLMWLVYLVYVVCVGSWLS